MTNNSLQPFFQQVKQSSLLTKIAAIAILAFGGAVANVVRENGAELLGYTGSIFASAVPIIAALFSIALMFKIPWQQGIILAVALVVVSFAFEEFPKLLASKLGPGFLSNLVGGIAAVLLAAVTVFVLAKALGGQNKRS